MFEAFMHPWSMIAGAALVSAPIVIHLINRMRFKRVRWAAMEFLLKAQKRMRRKMIIEQLLLLLLRCLLVLLAGLLLGRFLGFDPFGGKESRATAHVAILDDSPSMADFWRNESDGQMTTSFRQATRLLSEQIAPAAAQASTPQSITVLRSSDLAGRQKKFNFTRVNGDTGPAIRNEFAAYAPTTVRVSLVDALRKAKESLDAETEKDLNRVVHVLSDFRAIDWAQDGEPIRAAMKDLAAANVKVHLIDVAHPYRRDDKKAPLYHENVGITELTPRARVVAKDQAVEFVVKVKNFGGTELKDVRTVVLVNGDENRGQSLFIPTLLANQETALTFNLQFNQTGTAQKPLDAFNLVTARLELNEAGGLEADNVRHTVVEVRDRLGVLFIEGRPEFRDKKEGDGLYLRRMLNDSFGGLRLASGTVRDLEAQDLRSFSSVYLLNVPSVSEPAAKKLEEYVRGGGGLGVFLGPDVKPADYNKVLYKDGGGVFPVPLPEKPTDESTEDQKFVRRFGAFNMKILPRSPAVREHPAVRPMFSDELGRLVKVNEIEALFYKVFVDRYWPVSRIGKWKEDRSVQELFCLPNEKGIDTQEAAVIALLNRLPVNEPKYEKYKKYLDKLKGDIRTTVSNPNPMSLLSQKLDWLLCDQTNGGDESEPVLREFWSQPEMADLRADMVRQRDAVKYGDPLYLAKQFGRGRVTAVLTTAGEGWNEWASGNKDSQSCFVAVMAEMQRYLAGGGSEDNLTTGSDFRLTLDQARYKPTVQRTRLTFDGGKDNKPQPGQSAVVVNDLGEQPLEAVGDGLLLKYNEATVPGAYLFTLTRLKGPDGGPGDAAEQTETVAYPFNVDAAREGDLRRVTRDDVAQYAEKVPMHSPDDAGWLDELKQKTTDLSSTRWLYLVILLVLVVEQAMAVRLSYHGRSNDLEAHAPTAAAVVGRQQAARPEPEPAGVA